MKTLITRITVICCVGAAWGQQPSQAPKPDPGYKAYDVWIGDWQYEGQAQDSLIGPGGRFAGKQTVRWVLNGFFIEFRAREKGNLGDLEQVELDWYDPVARDYPFQGYLSIGDRYSAIGTVSGNVWRNSGTWTHEGTQYKIRGQTTFAADGRSNTWKSEISADGQTWALLSEGKATRIASSAATGAHKILMFIRDDPSPQLEYMLINEVAAMRTILKESGFEVTMATISGEAITADWITVTPDLKLSDVKIDDYAGFMLPCTATDTMPAQAVSFVQSIVSRRKPIAAQMGAVHVLGKAGVLDGKKFAFAEEKDDNVGMFPELKGGIYRGRGVVQDGMIITSGTCPLMAKMHGHQDRTAELTHTFVDVIKAGTK